MPRQPLRILVVDDNSLNRDLVRFQLEEFGFAVALERNGEGALQTLSTTAYDMVLLDLHMPVLGGREALRRLRGEPGPNRDVPVVALTAQTVGADRQTLRDDGFDEVLYKPLDMDCLAAVLEEFYPEAIASATAQGDPTKSSAWSCLLRRSNGSVSLAQMLLERLMEELPRQMEQIAQALETGQRAKARASAHKLHGSAAYFDLADIRTAADTLERLLMGPGTDREQDACSRLAAAIDDLLQQREAIMAEAALDLAG